MTKADKYIITIKVTAQHEKNNDRCGDFLHALCMSVREIIPYTVQTINLSYDVKKVVEEQ